MLRRFALPLMTAMLLLCAGWAQQPAAPLPSSAGTAYVIKAGKLIDPESGVATPNQMIAVKDGRIVAIGSSVTAPEGAETIDLSQYSVLPGLVDAHNHLAITYKKIPENDVYYYTYIQESTALRAIQAASNGMQMLSFGFTVVRDLGNNGLYADTALRQAIEQGWIPGPTIINSGIIIGGAGGQFFPTPEMVKEHNIVYPEYLDADTHDEIIKAVRQNVLFGAKVIKICVDCKPYPYSVDDIKLFIKEAANAGGLKVAGHVQTQEGARRAIEAGIWSIEHDIALTDELHKLMAQKGIWRVGTETPFTSYRGTQEAFDHTVARMKSAWANKVKMAFSTDADYYVEGLTRGQVVINFLKSWKAAGIPDREILKIMTINGYQVSDIYDRRGPIKVGLPADMIAVKGNPLEDIETLRNVAFVMKDGLVFKRDGVMTPEKFLHGGPVNGWRIR
ncbi:MAG TPA: amidohydrolase family protein [Candidatus Saccharimonadales bacterium]|jgi:imidazolonepropionase-like amidohydrolase|nr:amidohydrolase family protein [Candidatus Saccharimonadales bacterium]